MINLIKNGARWSIFDPPRFFAIAILFEMCIMTIVGYKIPLRNRGAIYAKEKSRYSGKNNEVCKQVFSRKSLFTNY